MILRFRRHDRDRATDEKRMALATTALTTTLCGLDAELSGLAARLKDAEIRGSFLLGTEDVSRDPRDAADERSLTKIEEEIMGGLHRLQKLQRLRHEVTGMLGRLQDLQNEDGALDARP